VTARSPHIAFSFPHRANPLRRNRPICPKSVCDPQGVNTERRIQASRANGALSRGPVTPQGKLRSAANGVRHGLLSQTIVLEGEDREAFAALLADLEADLQPQSPTDCALVEKLAVTHWRLMRLWAIETASFHREMEAHDPATHSPAARAALAFRNLSDSSRTLDLLNRYESRFDRQITRTLALLRKRLPREPVA